MRTSDAVQRIFFIFIFVLFLNLVYTDHLRNRQCPANLPRSTYVSKFQDSCLQIVSLSKTWTDARSDCQSRGGDLTQITSASKQSFIMTQLGLNHPQKVWIGGIQQAPESKWSWVSDEWMDVYYENWKSGQGPQHKGFSHARMCALLDYFDNGRWREYPCNSAFFGYHYICEFAQIITSTPQTRERTTVKTTTLSPTTLATTQINFTTTHISTTFTRGNSTLSRKVPASKFMTTLPPFTNSVTTTKALKTKSSITKLPTIINSRSTETTQSILKSTIKTSTRFRTRKSSKQGFTQISTNWPSRTNTEQTTGQNTTSSDSPGKAKPHHGSSNNNGMKGYEIAILVGVLALLGVVSLAVFILFRKLRSKHHTIDKAEDSVHYNTTTTSNENMLDASEQ